jgi:hypothetical protein
LYLFHILIILDGGESIQLGSLSNFNARGQTLVGLLPKKRSTQSNIRAKHRSHIFLHVWSLEQKRPIWGKWTSSSITFAIPSSCLWNNVEKMKSIVYWNITYCWMKIDLNLMIKLWHLKINCIVIALCEINFLVMMCN